MTDIERLKNLRNGTVEEPIRILMSACLTGITCGYDGTNNGEYPTALKLLHYSTARITTFCPEEYSFGTPREMCDIHGGDGFDVLAGKANVLTASGKDWTDGMVKASEKMLDLAHRNNVEVAVMMDISAACGSQVIYDGNRFSANKVYQIGVGVATAQLINHGIQVISQRDLASLEILYSKVDNTYTIDQKLIDHHQTEWYQSYFKHPQ